MVIYGTKINSSGFILQAIEYEYRCIDFYTSVPKITLYNKMFFIKMWGERGRGGLI